MAESQKKRMGDVGPDPKEWDAGRVYLGTYGRPAPALATREAKRLAANREQGTGEATGGTSTEHATGSATGEEKAERTEPSTARTEEATGEATGEERAAETAEQATGLATGAETEETAEQAPRADGEAASANASTTENIFFGFFLNITSVEEEGIAFENRRWRVRGAGDGLGG